ncbi:MAG: hypothetical protein LBU87_03955 [Lactobacillales bacterium]|jgi:hypothetical protein|nr:hypothetical protein [Lactobacillales bacterium]
MKHIPDAEKIRRYDLLATTILRRVQYLLDGLAYDAFYDSDENSPAKAVEDLLVYIDEFFSEKSCRGGYRLFEQIIHENFDHADLTIYQ